MGDVVPVAFRPMKEVIPIGEVVCGTCMIDSYDTYSQLYRSCDFANSTKEAGRLFQEDETLDGHFQWKAERVRDTFSSEQDLIRFLQVQAQYYAGLRQLLALEHQAIQRSACITNPHPRIQRGLLNLKRIVALKSFIAEGESYKFPAIHRMEGGLKSLGLVSSQMLFQLSDVYIIRIMK